MAKDNSVEIVVVLDRSGSMASIARDMEGGFDTMMDEQKKLPGECRVTLVQFDNEYGEVYSNKPVAEVPRLHLVPRGNTALFDAVGKTIAATGERLKNTPDAERPAKVLFIIITDGQENASTEYTQARVLEMITHQRDKYAWEFAHLGANQDSFAVAKDMGIKTSAVMNFMPDQGGVEKLYASVSRSTSRARSGGSFDINKP